MCGIFGIVSNSSEFSFKENQKNIQKLLKLSQIRGQDSSGLGLKILNNEVQTLKKPHSAKLLAQSMDLSFFLKGYLEPIFRKKSQSFALMGHARLVTNGTQFQTQNNHPILKRNCSLIHNGIITNVDNLYEEHKSLIKNFEVDSEILIELFVHYQKEGLEVEEIFTHIFNQIEGSASFCFFFNDKNFIILATNTGSLYWTTFGKTIFFSSELYILKKFLKDKKAKIQHLKPISFVKIQLENLTVETFNIQKVQTKNNKIHYEKMYLNLERTNEKLLQFPIQQVSRLKRCKKCILPETFPFIEFDREGICNFCNHYVPRKVKRKESLKNFLSKNKSKNENADCLVAFSGGRDSSYSLHYLQEELGIKPIAYTYDWGMVTDLARRNQSRICEKLGIEHIIVAANIAQKRKSIQKNVLAWLKRPNLGTIPLFMAGDKHFFYYSHLICKINNLTVSFFGENQLEATNFKSGFAGLKPNLNKEHIYHISSLQKIQMLLYYCYEFFRNPSYFNAGIFDSAVGFFFYYIFPHTFHNLFDYIEWNEQEIEKTLLQIYNWEISPDTKTTWRIGDGTAAFYNYIYYRTVGFSENDTFRSNQIREGILTRKKALELVNRENQPRYESIKWYLEAIDLDFSTTIAKINQMQQKIY